MSKAIKAAAREGDYLAICDRCGFRFPASKMRKTWDNLIVDDACFEERHPQDLERIHRRPSSPDFVSVEANVTLNSVIDPDVVCTIYTKQAVPGLGVPGCIIPGFHPVLEDETETGDTGLPTPTFPITGTL